jgi:pyrimidine operon attenuation protein/uracil phosphoribosyltransferase
MSETKETTIILNHKQVEQKVTRIAHEILENNFKEKKLVIMGIQKEGFVLASRLANILNEISTIDITLCGIEMNKKSPLESDIEIGIESKTLKNKVVILVDDVLNSGKTLIYATKHLLDQNIKGIQTVCLVDRKHRQFPIRADYVGLTLSTTLQDHITVEFGKVDVVSLA